MLLHTPSFRGEAFSAQAGQLPNIFTDGATETGHAVVHGIAGLGQSGLGLCCSAAVLFSELCRGATAPEDNERIATI